MYAPRISKMGRAPQSRVAAIPLTTRVGTLDSRRASAHRDDGGSQVRIESSVTSFYGIPSEAIQGTTRRRTCSHRRPQSDGHAARGGGVSRSDLRWRGARPPGTVGAGRSTPQWGSHAL